MKSASYDDVLEKSYYKIEIRIFQVHLEFTSLGNFYSNNFKDLKKKGYQNTKICCQYTI